MTPNTPLFKLMQLMFVTFCVIHFQISAIVTSKVSPNFSVDGITVVANGSAALVLTASIPSGIDRY